MKAKYKNYGWCLKKTDGNLVMCYELSWPNEVGPVIMSTRRAAREVNKGRFKVVKMEVTMKEVA